jgi:hypothetical protein
VVPASVVAPVDELPPLAAVVPEVVVSLVPPVTVFPVTVSPVTPLAVAPELAPPPEPLVVVVVPDASVVVPLPFEAAVASLLAPASLPPGVSSELQANAVTSRVSEPVASHWMRIDESPT